MRSGIMLTAVAVMAVITMGGIAKAQNGENTKRLDSQESTFLRDAAQEDIFMIRLGQYAADHAAMDDVKKLGRQMATDHQADLKQIEQLAKDHGVDLTGHDADLTVEQKTLYGQLTAKAGKDFDKDYTKLVVAHHNRMIGEYERERDHATDVAIREYAGKQVDGLQNHLKMSKDAEKLAWGT